MQEVKELWQREIGVKQLKSSCGPREEIQWNLTLKMKIFSKSEIKLLYVSAFLVLGGEVVLPAAEVPAAIESGDVFE